MAKPNLQVSATVLFVTLLIVGLVVCTMLARASITGDVPRQKAKPTFNTAEKLLDQRKESSKWLLALAYATLVGLIGLEMKSESTGRPSQSRLAMSSVACLLVSLYCAFLFLQATIRTLEEDADLLYGQFLDVPVLMQFYLFLFSLVLLGFWILRPKITRTVLLALMMPVFFSADDLQAADAACAPRWAAARRVDLSPSQAQRLATLQKVILERTKLSLPPVDECDNLFALADEIRSQASQNKEPFESQLADLEDQAYKQNFSGNRWLEALIDLCQPWRAGVDYAVLVVKSSANGLTIMLNRKAAGLTDWVRRVTPGSYDVEVLQAGRVVYSGSVKLSKDERKEIVVPEKK